MEDFYRIRRLPPYVFEQVNRAKAAARNAGADIIDLGMGNPDLPAPPHVLEKLKETIRTKHCRERCWRNTTSSRCSGMPSSMRLGLAWQRASGKMCFRR